MFAGPNGSGKSTLRSILSPLAPEHVGVYLNPDDIEAQVRREGILRLSDFGVSVEEGEVEAFFNESHFFSQNAPSKEVCLPRNGEGVIRFGKAISNPSFASVTVDFLRRKLVQARATFTFETVMSHPGKVELLKDAQARGYRTYLYFIATEDPEINVSRVRNRVSTGGHSVPEDRIRSRYERSLALLSEAIRYSNRAYVFDNSRENFEREWIAEITDGRIETKVDPMPAWFVRSVWDKAVKDRR